MHARASFSALKPLMVAVRRNLRTNWSVPPCPPSMATCANKFPCDLKGGRVGPPRPSPEVRLARPCRSAPGRPTRGLGANKRWPAQKPAETQPTAGGPYGSQALLLQLAHQPGMAWARFAAVADIGAAVTAAILQDARQAGYQSQCLYSGLEARCQRRRACS
jgi:hypothetical protein